MSHSRHTSPVPLSEVATFIFFYVSPEISFVFHILHLYASTSVSPFGASTQITYLLHPYVLEIISYQHVGTIPSFPQPNSIPLWESAIIYLHSYLLMDIQIVFSILLCQIELIEHPCTYVCTHVCKLNSQGQNF